MKFKLPKPQKGRSAWGWRLVQSSVHPDEARALRELYPDFRAAGSLPTRKKRDEYLARVQSEVLHRVHLIRTGVTPKASKRWDEAVHEFLDHGQARRGLRDTAWSQGTYTQRSRHLFRFWPVALNHPEYLSDVTREAVERAIDRMANKGEAPNTINTRIDSLSGLFSRAKNLRQVSDNPIEGVRRMEERVVKPKGFFDVAELKLLFTRPPQNFRLLYQIEYFSPFRAGDIAKINIENINWFDGVIRVKGILSQHTSGNKTKRDKFWKIPPHLLEELWDFCAGRPLTDPLLYVPRHPNLQLYRHMEEAGIPKVKNGRPRSMHSIRHSTATNRFVAGETIEEVSRRLGHEDVKTTAGYIDPDVLAAKNLETTHRNTVLHAAEIFPEAYSKTEHHEYTEGDREMATTMQGNTLRASVAEGVGFEPVPTSRRKSGQTAKNSKLIPFPKVGRKVLPREKVVALGTQAVHRMATDPAYAEFIARTLNISPAEADSIASKSKKSKAAG